MADLRGHHQRGGSDRGDVRAGPPEVPRSGQWDSGEERPSGAAVSTASALIVVALVLPEFHALIPNDNTAWMVYLSTSEMAKAILCLLLAAFAPPIRMVATAAAVWFTTQAADGLFNGNLWAEQTWEYPLLLVLIVVALIIQRKR